MSGERGRPTTYTPEIAAEIVERVAAGESLRAVCEDEDMPPESTVRSWAIDNREGFFAQYARAQDIRAHSLFDQIIEIADDSSRDTYEDENGNERVNTEVVQRARLRVDARKWYIGKVMPKVYGERVAMEHSGPNGGPVEVTVTRRVVPAAKNRIANGAKPAVNGNGRA